MLIDQGLAAFFQLFSWISAGPSECSIDKIIGSQDHLTLWAVPWVPCVLYLRTLSQKIFSKWINTQIRHCKKSLCPLNKISLPYWSMIGQRLTVSHELFSWTSVAYLKCPIDKMIGSQGIQKHFIVVTS